MSKTRMLFILSGLWLFAIVAPSVITLIDDDNTVVVGNFNEEEQQEQGKKGGDEKNLPDYTVSDFLPVSKLGDRSTYSYYLERGLDTTLEIVLPPPEHS